MNDDLIQLIYKCSTDNTRWPDFLDALESQVWEKPALAQHLDQSIKILDILAANQHDKLTHIIEGLPIGIATLKEHTNNHCLIVHTCNPAFLKVANANPRYFSVHKHDQRIDIIDVKIVKQIHDIQQGRNSSEHGACILLDSDIPTSIWLRPHPKGLPSLMSSCQNAAERIQHSMLYALFALTPSESRLVKCLCNGAASVTLAAKSTGISPHTARSQIKTIYHKTGVKSQLDLVKKVLTSVAVVQEQQPMLPTTKTMTLGDGRQLSYSEYGDADGVPILHFLSTGQSCHHFHYQLDQLAGKGIRLITAERPGIGCSTMKKDYSFKDVADDHAALLRYLSIKQTACLAFANGAPHAAAFAYHYPQCVSRVIWVSGILPTAFSDNAGILSKQRILIELSRRIPMLHTRVLHLLLRNLENNPESYIDEHRKKLSIHDNQAATPDMLSSAIKSFHAAIAKTLLGTIHDHYQTCADWGFSASELQVPFSIWHGKYNAMIHCDDARRFAQAIPQANFHEVNGGHLIFFSHFHEILADFRHISEHTSF